MRLFQPIPCTMRPLVASGVAALLLCFAASLPTQAWAEIERRPLQFAKGASSATVSGQIKGDQTVDHLLRAKAGQTMQVKLKTSNTSAYFNVLPPGSQGEAIFVGSTHGNEWTGVLPKDGEYTVRVYLMRNAARRNETARYTLSVGIAAGSAATGKVSSADALVPGTAFHATGQVACALGKDAPQLCDFGVIRSGPGHARVQITTPTGLKRTLRFAGSQVSADGGGAVKSSQQADRWTIEVNDFETFQIPDAVINGG